jgi:plastocyanin
MSVRVPVTFGAILTLGLAAACGGGTAATSTPASGTATPAAATATPAAATATPVSATATPALEAIVCDATGEGGAVSIAGFSYDPQEATAGVGEFITWTNTDGSAHTVTFDSGPNCGNVAGSGGTQTIQFNIAGSYPYHCAIHPDMTGTVEVS